MSTHPNKGQAWGGGKKVECPHCHEWKGQAHIRLCPQNPDRNIASIKKRSERMKQMRAAQKTTAESTPMPTPPTNPTPPAGDDPLAAVADQPTKPTTEVRRVDPGFMAKRVAELRKNGTTTPAATGDGEKTQPVVPNAVSVQERKGLPARTYIKIVSLVGALTLAVVGWRLWRNHKRPGSGRSTEPRNEVDNVQEKKWQGPRAWTPDPRKVSPNDYLPSEHGGGFVPSPQTSWFEAQSQHLNKRQGGG